MASLASIGDAQGTRSGSLERSSSGSEEGPDLEHRRRFRRVARRSAQKARRKRSKHVGDMLMVANERDVGGYDENEAPNASGSVIHDAPIKQRAPKHVDLFAAVRARAPGSMGGGGSDGGEVALRAIGGVWGDFHGAWVSHQGA